MPGVQCLLRVDWIGSLWGSRPSDMEFQKTKEAAAREIALAFGVPPMLLGHTGGCDLCQLSGGQPRVLPTDRVAVGRPGCGDFGGLAWRAYGRRGAP